MSNIYLLQLYSYGKHLPGEVFFFNLVLWIVCLLVKAGCMNVTEIYLTLYLSKVADEANVCVITDYFAKWGKTSTYHHLDSRTHTERRSRWHNAWREMIHKCNQPLWCWCTARNNCNFSPTGRAAKFRINFSGILFWHQFWWVLPVSIYIYSSNEGAKFCL